MQSDYRYRYSGYSKFENAEATDDKYLKKIDDVIDYYDLTVVFTGKLEYQIDDVDYTVEKGSAILIPPGSHRIRFQAKKNIEFISVNFFSEKNIPLPIYIPSCITSTLKDLLFLHIKLKNSRLSTFYEEKLNLSISMLILLLTENAERKLLNPHVSSILSYISKHYTENITLEDIAGSVYLTVPYCCNLVKKELGMTIYDIILKERILLAQEYIAEDTRTLLEISALCGFNDYSHFSKYFKKFTGSSPSKYKR